MHHGIVKLADLLETQGGLIPAYIQSPAAMNAPQ